jgi:hypothetical protein
MALAATCRQLRKSATSRDFWKKVTSILRTTIRTTVEHESVVKNKVGAIFFEEPKLGTQNPI